MDAWIRFPLLCASLLTVSAAPWGEDPEATQRPDAAAARETSDSPTESLVSRTGDTAADGDGFDGTFVAPDRVALRRTEVRAKADERTAHRRRGGQNRGTYATRNFVVYACTKDDAKAFCLEAERCRQKLAVWWLGETLPDWPRKCPITITRFGPHAGSGGATTFRFGTTTRGGRTAPIVTDFRMEIEGNRERILDSVIPHEVNHTVFASYFKRPLPRWADEGAATLPEFTSEKQRQRRTLEKQWTTHKYRLGELLGEMDYPGDPRAPSPGAMRQIGMIYAQGYALADYLVQAGGPETFLKVLLESGRYRRLAPPGRNWEYPRELWDRALRKHYGFGVAELESKWTGWVVAKYPAVPRSGDVRLAAADRPRAAAPRSASQSRPAPPRRAASAGGKVVRAQTPDRVRPTPARPATPKRTARVEPPAPPAPTRPVPARPAPVVPTPIPSFTPYGELIGG